MRSSIRKKKNIDVSAFLVGHNSSCAVMQLNCIGGVVFYAISYPPCFCIYVWHAMIFLFLTEPIVLLTSRAFTEVACVQLYVAHFVQ